MKTKFKGPEIIIIRENLVSIQVCTSIPPSKMDTIPEKLITCHGETGTICGKWVLDPKQPPIKCDKYFKRWHYVLYC